MSNEIPQSLSAKETEKMNIQGEMMNDAMDAMGDGETENQADEVYN